MRAPLAALLALLFAARLPRHAAANAAEELEELAALARSMARTLPPPPSPAADRLGALVLLSQGLGDATAARRLRCSLLLLREHVGSATPLDVYVWVLANDTAAVPAWLATSPDTHVLRVPPAAWRVPPGHRNQSTWAYQGTTLGYRLMGTWRLGFAFAFAAARGHDYLLQTDDDTFVHQSLGQNVVALMRERGVLVANRNYAYREIREVSKGLAELAAFYVVTRGYAPEGPLYSHCTPPNARGLHTVDEAAPVPNGWDAESLSGHFNVFDLRFWFSPPVQDFVRLAWASRGPLEQRWQEPEWWRCRHCCDLNNQRLRAQAKRLLHTCEQSSMTQISMN
jgi:hypothetical protein